MEALAVAEQERLLQAQAEQETHQLLRHPKEIMVAIQEHSMLAEVAVGPVLLVEMPLLLLAGQAVLAVMELPRLFQAFLLHMRVVVVGALLQGPVVPEEQAAEETVEIPRKPLLWEAPILAVAVAAEATDHF
jgi:hypothetical protein